MFSCCFTGKQTNDYHGSPASSIQTLRQGSAKDSKLPKDKLGSALLAATNNGPLAVLAMLRQNRPSPGIWAVANPVENLKTRARALAESIDVILDPLLDVVDRKVGSDSDNDNDGDDYASPTNCQKWNWQDIQVKQITNLVCETGAAMYSDKALGRWGGTVETIQLLLEVLKSVWAVSDNHLPQTFFQSRALNRLMGMVAVVYCRRVTMETPSEWQARDLQWKDLCESLGLRDKTMPVALNPASKALMVFARVSGSGEEKMTLQVRRRFALWDSMAAAEERGVLDGKSPRFHKIFPQFVIESKPSLEDEGGEVLVEQGEGHGPRKEFFALVASCAAGTSLQDPSRPSASFTPHPSSTTSSTPAGAAAAAEEHGDRRGAGGAALPRDCMALFSFNRSAGCYWYDMSLREDQRTRKLYCLFGWLMGQALCNHCTMGMELPTVMFQYLLRGEKFKPNLGILQNFDPEMARAITNTSKLPDKDFKALLEMEGMDSGTSREEYVRSAVYDRLAGSVAWQAAALREGFFLAMDAKLLKEWVVSAADLREMVCGPSLSSSSSSSSWTVRGVFRVVGDEELGGSMRPLLEELWKVVDAWPADLRSLFVLFVTGSERLPLPGTELLRIELPFVAVSRRDHQNMLGMLPQAHTCENILELPNYWESLVSMRRLNVENVPEDAMQELRQELRQVLGDRLKTAVTHCRDYGLDVIGSQDNQTQASTSSPFRFSSARHNNSSHNSTINTSFSSASMGKKNKVHPLPEPTNVYGTVANNGDASSMFGVSDGSPGKSNQQGNFDLNLGRGGYSAVSTSANTTNTLSPNKGKNSIHQLDPLPGRSGSGAMGMRNLFDDFDSDQKDKDLEQMMSEITGDVSTPKAVKRHISDNKAEQFVLNERPQVFSQAPPQSLDDMIAEFSLD